MKKEINERLKEKKESQKIKAEKELRKNCFRSFPNFYWLETDIIKWA